MSKFDYDSYHSCPKFRDFTKATSPERSGADESYFERCVESPAGGLALRNPAEVILAASTQPKSAMSTACALQDAEEKTPSQDSTSLYPIAVPASVHKPTALQLLTKDLPKQGKEHTVGGPATRACLSTFDTGSHASNPQSETAMPSLLHKFCGLLVDAGNISEQPIKQESSQPGKATKVENKDAYSSVPRPRRVGAGHIGKEASRQQGKPTEVQNKKRAASSLPSDSIDCPKFRDFTKATSQGSGADESYFERHEESPDGRLALRNLAEVALAASTQPKSAMSTAWALQDAEEKTPSEDSTSLYPIAVPASVHKPTALQLLTKDLPKQGKEHTVGGPATRACLSTFDTGSHASNPQSETAMPSLLHKFCGLLVDAGNISKQPIKQESSQPGKATKVENKDAYSSVPRPRRVGAGHIGKEASRQQGKPTEVQNKKRAPISLPSDSIDCPKFRDFTKATSQGSGADESYFERHEESPDGRLALRNLAEVALAASTQPKSAMSTAWALQDAEEKTPSQDSTSLYPIAVPASVHKPTALQLLTKDLPKQGKEHTVGGPATRACRSTFDIGSHASNPQSVTAMPSLLHKFCGLLVDAGNISKQPIKQESSQQGNANKFLVPCGLVKAQPQARIRTLQSVKSINAQPQARVRTCLSIKSAASRRWRRTARDHKGDAVTRRRSLLPMV
ncbi:hypothetical protein HPB50_027817 [Hyalomma asiaticum]|nr:hypothetical protein HPB50_027817 [Hyalomma asiaticum]